jgi:hypothetical protein
LPACVGIWQAAATDPSAAHLAPFRALFSIVIGEAIQKTLALSDTPAEHTTSVMSLMSLLAQKQC